VSCEPRNLIPWLCTKLHGKPGRRPFKVDELAGVGDIWAPPGWFDDQQHHQWHYSVEHAPPGLLGGTDREILVVWVVAAVEHARACQKVRELEQVVTTREGGVMQNPYLGVMNRQAHIMLRAASELGFSPAARAGLGRMAPEFDPHAPSLGQPRNNARLARYLDAKPDKLN
jgi:P27 family predicted phage terminase small subunit